MNENIDLTKILKNYPKGQKLYSPLFGEVDFEKIRSDDECTIVITKGEVTASFTKEGFYYADLSEECLLFPSKEQRDWSKFTTPWYKEEKLVKPKFKVGDRVRRKGANKDNVYKITKVYDESYGIAGLNLVIYMKYQDQYELVHNKFDPKTLKPFDKVLVRNFCTTNWRCTFFSHQSKDVKSRRRYVTSGNFYVYCIPYNDDTKHLVGTTEEAPDYYRY